jgi:hypothetical protein
VRVRLAAMDPAIDVAKLPPQAARILDPKTPPAMRAMAAKGIAPGLKPVDMLAVVAILAESEDATLAATAQSTLDKLPPQLLNGALTPDLHPGVLDVIGPRFATDMPMMERILALPQIALPTVACIAMKSREPVSELIATNEDRLLRHPEIIERLYMNKSTRMSTSDRMIELAARNQIDLPGIPAFKEAVLAISEELIPVDAPAEPTPEDLEFQEAVALAAEVEGVLEPEDVLKTDDETGKEVPVERVKPLYARIGSMKASQKIRLAQTGGAAERELLVRDPDRRVAIAAVVNPNVQDNEITRVSASRNVSEDVLRHIAGDAKWTRHYAVKLNLVSNPRCPLTITSKLIPLLRENELKQLAKSKNVSSAVSKAAKQQLERKTH